MREIRQSGSEGGEATLPTSITSFRDLHGKVVGGRDKPGHDG
jgi:hypothetical protein